MEQIFDWGPIFGLLPKHAQNGPKHRNLNYFKSRFLLLRGSSAHSIVDRPSLPLVGGYFLLLLSRNVKKNLLKNN